MPELRALTTEEIVSLRDRAARVRVEGVRYLRLTDHEAYYLQRLMTSHIAWKRWLTPED